MARTRRPYDRAADGSIGDPPLNPDVFVAGTSAITGFEFIGDGPPRLNTAGLTNQPVAPTRHALPHAPRRSS
ncbi:hypothetical protein [Micromonospora sp. NPDC005367]|uniref:hypothetical protein n=1 Tax=Micromonospora sp. NPDC005367 TaxID=3155590 RepID=UPI0033BC2FEA